MGKGKVSKYVVVLEPDLLELENKVNQLIKQGFEPHGSLTIDHPRFFQVMIKRVKTKIP